MDEPEYDVQPEASRLPRFWMLLALLALALVVWSAVSPRRDASLGELHLRPLTFVGDEVTLDDLKGQVVVLNFWGTWCPPCKKELPHIAELAARYRQDRRCQVLAVSCGSEGFDPYASLADLGLDTKLLLKAKQLDLSVYADPDGVTRLAVKQAVGFSGYPTTLVLDNHGVIRRVWSGYGPGDEVEVARLVEELLSAF